MIGCTLYTFESKINSHCLRISDLSIFRFREVRWSFYVDIITFIVKKEDVRYFVECRELFLEDGNAYIIYGLAPIESSIKL